LNPGNQEIHLHFENEAEALPSARFLSALLRSSSISQIEVNPECT